MGRRPGPSAARSGSLVALHPQETATTERTSVVALLHQESDGYGTSAKRKTGIGFLQYGIAPRDHSGTMSPMPIATIRFDLDDFDDERQHRYALAGREALIALEVIDNHCRSLLKHGEIGDEARAELESVRRLIPHELVSLLH